MISYTSFWVENSEPFQWLFKTIFLIFGVTFPVQMFPMFLQPIIKASPVYAALSGPCSMVVNFNMNEFIFILVVQVFYIFILQEKTLDLLIIMLFKRLNILKKCVWKCVWNDFSNKKSLKIREKSAYWRGLPELRLGFFIVQNALK